MQEARLRELATALRGELGEVVEDDEQRARVASKLDEALALPEGEGREALQSALREHPQTREWTARRLPGGKSAGRVRILPGLAGGLTEPLGVHFVCPKGDFDVFLESPTQDPGRCPHHGARLVRSDD
jgi:hypothetical protein